MTTMEFHLRRTLKGVKDQSRRAEKTIKICQTLRVKKLKSGLLSLNKRVERKESGVNRARMDAVDDYCCTTASERRRVGTAPFRSHATGIVMEICA